MDLERLKRRNENCAKGREVLEMLRTKQEELIEGQRSELAETVRESGEVFSQAESTTELRIDTEIGLAISQIHVKRVQRIATSFESVTLQDFVACIAQMVHTTHDRQTNATTRPSSSQRGQPDGWARLGAQHTRMISCGPRFASFLGAITKEEEGNPTEKKRRVRNAAATLPQAQQITITANVDNDDEQREGSELSKRTGYLKKILHQLQRVALPQFVIDPESYINTVENLFHLSFLIRQGVAEIVVEDGASILVYKHLDGNASIDASDLTFKQAVIRLDYETWEVITCCVSPSYRDYHSRYLFPCM
eukprot:TRINITY_DN10424_c0_g1_i2.p1 TRINITY_DN10424_c0_g1~~TRINITY_DN10424_c0_g1_i2.p1  ORF type:complete len:307 (+),score=72.32 TRINITY_DN10424_c0_g1_i2:49-969(+)